MTHAVTTEETFPKLDPIRFEVLRHKLDEIMAEAYHTIGRVSGSPVVYEVGDHQEALLTANGDVAAFGAGVLHWVQSISRGVKHVHERYLENPGINEDDQFLVNDTYIASVHGNDIQLLAPIFWQGELIAWAGTSSHQTDIGGIDPGSLCVSATEVFQEGFLTPGVKFVEGGTIRRDVEDTFRNMVRDPDLGLLDIRAKIAANNVIKKRVIEMLDRYGRETVLGLFQQLLEYSAERLKRRISTIPEGTWRAKSYIEGVRDEYLSVEVAITKEGDRLTVDFTGSSPQTEGSENISSHGAISSAMNPLLAMLCYDMPWNSGLFEPVDFILPENSIVNPQRPAAISTNTPAGANMLVMTAAHNALSKMFLASEDYRDEACGNIGASFNNFVLAGARADGNYFATLILDGLAGGTGAGPDGDGENSVQNHWAVRTMISNVETIEMIYPVLYLWRREICDSGGPGRHRGGLGIETAMTPLGVDQMAVVNLGAGVDPRNCLGVAGGYPAAHAPSTITRGSINWQNGGTTLPKRVTELEGENDAIPTKGVSGMVKSDVLHAVVGTGGGGYGDPLERDPEAVARDVAEGCVSDALALDVYGVVLAPSDLTVDLAATNEARSAMKNMRLQGGSHG